MSLFLACLGDLSGLRLCNGGAKIVKLRQKNKTLGPSASNFVNSETVFVNSETLLGRKRISDRANEGCAVSQAMM